MNNNTEYRSAGWEAAKSGKISGYAVVFEQRTVLYKDPVTGHEYGEIIDRGALNDTDMGDVILRYDHNGRVLARTRNNSLRLSIDDHGLFIEADMGGSDEARSFYEDVKAGLVDKMSFCFNVSEDEWDEATRTRRVKRISRLYDVSLVSFPAYEQTQVNARRRFEALAESDRIAFFEDEAHKMLTDIDAALGKYDELINANPQNFMTREELAHNRELPYPMQRPGDDRDPIFREMLEIRTEWGSVVGKSNVQKAQELRSRFHQLEKELAALQKEKRKAREAVAGGAGTLIETFKAHRGRKDNNMENIEIRAFQKYISAGSVKNLTAEERTGLATSGAGAIMPVEIYNRMITETKYSDLLSRATVLNMDGAGTVKVPIASHTDATWKNELQAITAAAPTLTSIDLAGKELMRAIQYSAAVEHMSVHEFTTWMADLAASEVVETLESAFICGDTSDDAPHNGLQHLTWTPNTNAITATASITAADVAKGLSLLPQRYARNAILLMNADAAYNTVGLFKGTSEYAYSLADGAARFMGKEIHISEYCADDEIYIIDPAQLYVRFAMRPIVEVDKSVGFLSATNTMRCLTVVDYAWNPAAAVRVGVAAG